MSQSKRKKFGMSAIPKDVKELQSQLYHLTRTVDHLLKFTVSVSSLNPDLSKAQQHMNALKNEPQKNEP